MRPILAFDTSAAHCAVAVFWPNGARAPICRSEDMAKGQAERLLPMIEETLTDAGLVWADLAAIGVGIGPGNFTGIRISVALARGLAMGLGIPAIGVTGFDARALNADLPDFWVTIPAPRAQIYAQRFGTAVAPAIYDTQPTGAPVLALADMPATDLTHAIARSAAQRLTYHPPRPAPFYLRLADAAPPSDPPPIIFADE